MTGSDPRPNPILGADGDRQARAPWTRCRTICLWITRMASSNVRGLPFLRHEAVPVLDERSGLDSPQDVRRQLPLDMPDAEVVMQRAVLHAEHLDEGTGPTIS